VPTVYEGEPEWIVTKLALDADGRGIGSRVVAGSGDRRLQDPRAAAGLEETMASTQPLNRERSLIPNDYRQRRSTFWIVALVLIVTGIGLYLSTAHYGRNAAETNAGSSTPQTAPATSLSNPRQAQTAPSVH